MISNRRFRMNFLTGAAVGAVAQYFLDPVSGRGRRAQTKQQSLARLRRPARAAQDRMSKNSKLLRDRTTGLVHETRQRTRAETPVDDATLVNKVRSEVLGAEEWRWYAINVEANSGSVTLRGQVDTEDAIERLESAVSRVPGTFRVVNLLHLPGEPAPNVEDALRASAGQRPE